MGNDCIHQFKSKELLKECHSSMQTVSLPLSREC